MINLYRKLMTNLTKLYYTMNLTNKTYQALRDLILKSEGKTLEDELIRGCYLKTPAKKIVVFSHIIKHDTGEKIVTDSIGYQFKAPTKAWIDYVCLKEDNTLYHYGMFDKSKILGQPITLDRVLMALGDDYYLRGDGVLLKYFEYSEDAEYELIKHLNLKMDLDKPLHQQSPETWESLIKILLNVYTI